MFFWSTHLFVFIAVIEILRYCVDKLYIRMVRVFEYDKKGRKYVKDMKTGRRWLVRELGKKIKKSEKESVLTSAQELKVEKRQKKETPSRDCGLVGDQEVLKEHRSS